METFGERLKHLRESFEYTQGQVAYKLGITLGTLSHWENGRRKPSYEDVGKLAEFFNVTTDYLVGRTSVPDGEVISKFNVMSRKVSVYGRIPAGMPFEAIEDIEEEIDIPGWLSKKKDLFGLRIVGESMNKIVPNGSIAVLQKTSHLENGEVGAIMVNGYDATLKKFYKLTDSIVLEPLSYDESFKPTVIKDGEEPVEIVGKLLWFSSQEGCKF